MDLTPPAEREWYARHGCTHAHCPAACEHPQPFAADGRLLCGACWVLYGEISEMVPCGPDICEEVPRG